MRLSDVQALEHLAARITSGELAGEDALAALRPYSEAEAAAANVIHLLYHFVADADIRAIEPDYERKQTQRLKVILASLQHDAT